MTVENRNALLTTLFYSISVSAIVLMNNSAQFKSGPCTPGLDLLSFFLLGPISIVLLIKNGLSAFCYERQTKQSFLIYVFALTIWLLVLFLN